MIRLSNGLRTMITKGWGINTALAFGRIYVYGSEPQPQNAIMPPSGDLLAIVSSNGVTPIPGIETGGLVIESSDFEEGDPKIKDNGDWVMKCVKTGEPRWWRFVGNADDPGGVSLYLPRVDGTVGESFFLPESAGPTVTEGDSLSISFTLYFP